MSEHDEPGASSEMTEQRRPRGGAVVVGIGASAGGLQALKAFFATIPADSGIAFVIVVHLSPDHESHLADLLQPHSGIPVTQVTAETAVEPNHVYVIPPGRNLSAVDSHLRLSPMDEARSGRAPVDHFFRTLSETHDGASIGVILSGTGSDGAAGMRYIREHGGLAIAQDPEEAEYDGMPRSAIATGGADVVLPVAGMMAQILEFKRTRPLIAASLSEHPEPAVGDLPSDPLHSVLTLVRLHTGHDFLRYKRSTVARRIARRMQILNLEALPEYLEVIRDDAHEATTLLHDLLINVTSFFRDAEVFRILESDIIPALFRGKGREEAVRAWSVGCATGEEAYTLGMLLLEEAARHPNPPQVQVFATDLHEPSLQHGREALFSEMIEAEVSPERIRRFFRRDSGGYRVTKELRDIVVFAPHNLLRDPPFSRQDLIVCRNVLIYLQRDVQEEIIELFHYALRAGGRLLLGTAEVLGRPELFTVENKAAHVYRRREGHRGRFRIPVSQPLAHARVPTVPGMPRGAAGAGNNALHQKMLERYAPPSILVGADAGVIHLSDNVGRYLRLPGGEPTSNLFKLVREEFRLELRSALQSVKDQRTPWRSSPITVRVDGEDRAVTVRVSSADESELEGLTLVIFDEGTEAPVHPDHAPEAVNTQAGEIEAELRRTRARVQALIEEFETTQEEMRIANEELQSANEELRSTMEELETSREELQSVNEELQTLNQENRHKVEELSQLSSDLQNLLQATDAATIFLDRNLRILRYTPRVVDLFNVRHTDRGRPLADITHRLGYNRLIDDAQRVLQTLVASENEVEGPTPDSWLIVRVAPYRTVTDRIDGVIITLVDVTALRNAEARLRRMQEREAFAARLRDAIRGLSDSREIQQVASRVLAGQLGVNHVTYCEMEDAGDTSAAGDGEASFTVRDMPPGVALDEARMLIDDAGERTRNAVRRARAREALRASEERYRLTVAGTLNYAIFTTDADAIIRSWSPGAAAVFGWTEAEAIGQPFHMTFTPEDRAAGAPDLELAQARRDGSAPDRRWHQRRDGSKVFIDGATHLLIDVEGAERFVKVGQDVTHRHALEQSLRDLNASLEGRVAERTQELSRANEARDALRLQLLQAEEQERARLARELHDEVAQHLVVLGLGLQALSDVSPPDSEVDRRAAQLRATVVSLSQEMHSLAVRLRPRALDDFGLQVALGAYVDAWSQRSGIPVELHAGDVERLHPSVETTIYRVVQEALTNVAKHSRATRAGIVVDQRDGQVVVTIEDNGRGFDTKARTDPKLSQGLGLLGIQERATLFGGTSHVESTIGNGTTVFVRIPVSSVITMDESLVYTAPSHLQ